MKFILCLIPAFFVVGCSVKASDPILPKRIEIVSQKAYIGGNIIRVIKDNVTGQEFLLTNQGNICPIKGNLEK
jgi:hypothetical protein